MSTDSDETSPPDEPVVRRVRVKISGRVQGVCFRAFTRERASELGLDGWVRNLPDRSVEASFCGPADRIDLMLEWCWEGSP